MSKKLSQCTLEELMEQRDQIIKLSHDEMHENEISIDSKIRLANIDKLIGMRKDNEPTDSVCEPSIKTENAKSENGFMYFASARHVICDKNYIGESDRTFDMPFFDLANNSDLLDNLHLYYMQGNYGVKYNYHSRGEWFCGYISAFSKEEEKGDEMREKLITNPTVTLLITDNELLEKVKQILNK